MFAKKVLISLALIAAMPLALSRHLRSFEWEDPDILERRFPPANIEDLHFSESDVIPDVENAVDYGEDDNQGQNIDSQNRDNFGREVNNERDKSKVPSFDDSPNKVHPSDLEIVEDDNSENDANNLDDYPDIQDVIVPEDKWHAREPVVIMVRPSEEEIQDFPEYNENTENKNDAVPNWDNYEDLNDIPQETKSFRERF